MRRLRANAGIRAMLKETQLVPAQLIQPIFVTEGSTPEAVASMPGVERLPIPLLVEKCRELVSLGVYGVALFPKTPDEKKTPDGREATNPDCLICRQPCRFNQFPVPFPAGILRQKEALRLFKVF